MKADTKRTELLEECKKLEAAQDKGDVSQQDRLNEVRQGFSSAAIYYFKHHAAVFFHVVGVR